MPNIIPMTRIRTLSRWRNNYVKKFEKLWQEICNEKRVCSTIRRSPERFEKSTVKIYPDNDSDYRMRSKNS